MFPKRIILPVAMVLLVLFIGYLRGPNTPPIVNAGPPADRSVGH